MTTALTAEQLHALDGHGFYVEELTVAVYGEGWWNGMFRWNRHDGAAFQDFFPSPNRDDAWQKCWDYAVQLGLVQDEAVRPDPACGAPA